MMYSRKIVYYANYNDFYIFVHSVEPKLREMELGKYIDTNDSLRSRFTLIQSNIMKYLQKYGFTGNTEKF